MKQWEVWTANFPFEEDNGQSKLRPVIVLSVEPLWILSIKVTNHSPRYSDEYDVNIKNWKQAGLCSPSTARISKSMGLSKDSFNKKIGMLHIDDRKEIINTYFKWISDKKQEIAIAE